MNESNFEMILDKLAEQIRIGKRPLIGAGRLVDDNACLTLIEELKSVIPTEISEARVVLQERDRLIKDARDTANATLAQAEEDANRMLNENDIIAQARREAQKIVESAQVYANNITQQYYAKIAEVMQNSENYLKNTAQDITNAKYELFKQMNNGNKRNPNQNN